MAEEVVERLGNVHLSDDEDDEIVLDDGIVQEAVSTCRFSFLGKLLTAKRYNVQAMKESLRRAWGMPTSLRIVEVDANLYHFMFASEDQFNKVINGGPWNFDNHLLVLRAWEPGLVSKGITFNSVECWVQIWGLPVGFISSIIGETIGNKIGEVLAVDNKAIAADRGKFIRIRVRLSLDKPLKRGSNIVLGKGSRYWLDYKYERLNLVCFYCGLIGHEFNGCSSKTTDERAERARPNKFGEEIKAGIGVRRGMGASQEEVGNPESGSPKGSATGVTAANQRSGKGPLITESVETAKECSMIRGGFGGVVMPNSNLVEVADDALVSLNGKKLSMGDLIQSSPNLNSKSGGSSSSHVDLLERTPLEATKPTLVGLSLPGPKLGSEGLGNSGPAIPYNLITGLDNLLEITVQENSSNSSAMYQSPMVFKAGREANISAKKRAPIRGKNSKCGVNSGLKVGEGSKEDGCLGKKRLHSEPTSGEGSVKDVRKERRIGDKEDRVQGANPMGPPPAP
ncbi:hypothetical protein Vadar_026558 [Vaccinium darrowii]|uniref:Uncharacterized protein n=1 Tax=Vaccinium darrowii TaxID=229202 RepID=A0ACB7XCE0_9ERIC|nr:hypothetical protein Vadar_026558 [Vaccinium darrowii]